MRDTEGKERFAERRGECKLGLLDGEGELQLVLDGAGRVVGASGAWRPKDDVLGFDELRELLPAGATLTYRGPAIADGEVGEYHEVVLEVEITAVEPSAEEPGTGDSAGLASDGTLPHCLVRLGLVASS